jgi:hypothetical protein
LICINLPAGGGVFALIYLDFRRAWRSHNWYPYWHNAPGGGPETGPALRAKADKQPRQPGHGVVQTGSPLKRPNPQPFKEQTALNHRRHYATQLALCK